MANKIICITIKKKMHFSMTPERLFGRRVQRFAGVRNVPQAYSVGPEDLNQSKKFPSKLDEELLF